MADPRESQFWRSAVRSGLLDDEALQSCWERIPEEKKREPEAIDRRLARQAVNAGSLTVWQAQQLLTGRATGFKIDRYVLLDLLGQGGMGRVYLAKDTRLGRRVAIKVLSKERMSNPRAIARFEREAKVGAQLQHENLVRIYDQGESSGIHYLVMEYIDGRNAAQIIGERGAIPWPEAAGLARQIALGLEHAQQKGLIHRDVNPANIMVTREGVAKLADLGLAIDLADEANVTRDGATVGTFDYISPEQARHSREVDTRADVYSLGCTLYHMIAGRVPFPMPSLPEKLYAHQLHEPEPLTAPDREVPAGLVEVVRRMMRKHPEERYASPLLAAQALEPFAEHPPGYSSASASSSGLRVSPSPLPPGASTPALDVSAPAVAADAPATVAAPAPAPFPALAEAAPSGSEVEAPLFALDLGPEAPLTASLSTALRPKARPKPAPEPADDAKAGPEPKPESKPKAPRPVQALSPRARKAAPVVAGLLVVVLGVVGIASVVATSRKKLERRPADDRGDDAVVAIPGPATDAGKAPGPISVKVGATSRTVDTLAEAIAIAAGASGEVVLAGPGPIRVKAAREIRLPRGRVTIRAADGPPPVLVVEMVGGRPWLLTLAKASISLRGLRVVAEYAAPAAPTPLIEAGGPVTLERCAFIAAGASGGSRCVKVEGNRVDAEGCLFVGFDRAMEITAFAGLQARVSQSIVAHAAGDDRAPGWAIRVAFSGGGDAGRPRSIALDRVTAVGGGLLEVVEFPATTPLAVSLDRVAVQAPALLAWSPREGESAGDWGKGLKWTGKKDLLDVTGSAWVVVSASGELPTPDAPRDLAAWQAAVHSDQDSVARSFKLADDPSAIASNLPGAEPGQFALVGDGVEGFGADVARVGPPGAGKAPRKAETSKNEPVRKVETKS